MAERHSTARTLARAAQYVRMSSGKQERSPAQQKGENRKLAKAEGCEIVVTFSDEAITGDSGPEQRPGFRQLLAAAERGEFEVLLLENVDRLGRFDSLEGAEYYNRLRRAGVKIITCNDGPIDLDSFEGWLVQTVRQEGKHSFLKDLSQRVLRGQMAAAKAGCNTGGRELYGFDRAEYDPAGNLVRRMEKGQRKAAGNLVKLIPSEDTIRIEAIRYAFSRFASADIGLSSLARELQGKGFPSPTGIGWSNNALRKILSNPKYIGMNRWAATSNGKYFTVEGDQIVPHNGDFRSKPAEDTILVDGAHEGLVEKRLFDRVQKKLVKTRGGKRKRRADYPLTGLIFCKHCGQPMVGSANTIKSRDGKKVYHYTSYVCRMYNKHGRDGVVNMACGHHRIDAKQATGWLVRKLQEVYLGPGREKLVKEIRKQLKDTAKNGQSDTKRLKRRLGQLDKELGRLVTAIRTVDAPELVNELAKVRDERDRIVSTLDRTANHNGSGTAQSEAERIADELWTLGEKLTGGDPGTLREVFRRLVSKIECEWDDVPTKSGGTKKQLVGGKLFMRRGNDVLSRLYQTRAHQSRSMSN